MYAEFDQPRQADPRLIGRNVLELVTRRWWLVTIQGIAAIVLGLSTVIWPQAMLTIVAVFVGINVALVGIFALAASLKMRATHTRASQRRHR